MTTVSTTPEPRICEKGGGGLFLPMSQSEQDWPKGLRIILYGIGLCYFFFGASLISDYFMTGIETITSKKAIVLNKRTGLHVTVLVWNSTVANLTLMALGSSAPEILLSLLETWLNEFYSGDLGPSTIVGSAAFNLFTIIAVCIIAIPSWEVRRIKELDVFNITAVFSIFAYVWLLCIVVVITPNVIDVAEAICTALIFPFLVTLCFFADKGYFRKKERVEVGDENNRCMKTVILAPMNAYSLKGVPPRARSIVMHKHDIEHIAAVHHEDKLVKMGSLAKNRGSQVLLGDVGGLGGSALPPGEPHPAGDDGEVMKDLYGQYIDNPNGVITYTRDIQYVDGGESETTAKIIVVRRNGSKGSVSCKYHAEHMNALPGYDYREDKHADEQMITFEDGVCMATIEMTILPVRPCESNEKFQIVLDNMEGGAIFNPNDDGGEESCVITIVIKNDNDKRPPTLMDRWVNRDLLAFGKDVWKEQVMESLQVEKMKEDAENPSPMDYVMHVVAVPWKFVYAVLTPPPQYLGGWLLFFIALVHIGFLTALVCDLASLFGCCLDIQDLVTAIIVVAPGTSLPDLFASKSAAMGDEDADASIVNVTGSNSVNVFLGIGISWSASSIYWACVPVPEKWRTKYPDMVNDYPNGAFVVKGGALSFSVLIFAAFSAVAICVLRGRRSLYDGELGGPPLQKFGSAAFLVSLYVVYSVLSVWKASTDAVDIFQWISIAFAGVFIMLTLGAEAALKAGRIKGWKAPDNSNNSENSDDPKSPLKEDMKALERIKEDNDTSTELPTPCIEMLDEILAAQGEVTGAVCKSCNNTGIAFTGKPCGCGIQTTPDMIGKDTPETTPEVEKASKKSAIAKKGTTKKSPPGQDKSDNEEKSNESNGVKKPKAKAKKVTKKPSGKESDLSGKS